ncbi:capsular polysaccharide export protein [Paraburkholderia caballeronis]|uniref:capsular polysaccharide export protein, LipB/KpsS family n=1 Tax=Paraburkholderia caballeronis TaxID=416943 RepID=UPI001064713F|nr:capsular polysaccharide biosynthesis protein [Paraburkholderia caballeronis]TDV37320.1 capsular polysaccharide export protein [Paraburkholderia caballeronis]
MKVNSLIRRGTAFFTEKEDGDVLFAFNFPAWKRKYIRSCFPGFRLRFLPARGRIGDYAWDMWRVENSRFLVWGYKQPEGLGEYADSRRMEVWRVEDGFLRSVGLGSKHILPLSICVDKSSLYYDARSPSDLEKILNQYDFDADHALMAEARDAMNKIRSLRLTKYNLPQTNRSRIVYGSKSRRRVLVIGQVEGDQSIKLGCDRAITNNDVVRLAASENPGAQIIYKVHPDILAGMRSKMSDPAEVRSISTIVSDHMSLDDSLDGVDQVYTISSLAGFESLLRGVPVTTVGCPFYSGWGLTDDRQINVRRTRKLSLEEIFAGAYVKYARYFDPKNGAPISIGDAIEKIVSDGIR